MTPIEFTGERYIPGHGGAQMAYEHLHRYLFSLRWAKGSRVLDVATGAGYGAALLASAARWVCAVEMDSSAILHARKSCTSENLTFVQADATRLPLLAGSVDLIVAMEILEHVANQDGLVRELARVAQPKGVVLISTPNKASYSDAREYQNPFHVRELYRDEFQALLAKHFGHVRLMNQQVRAGSLIACEAAAQGDEVIKDCLVPVETAVAEPMYLLAQCSHDEPPDLPPAASAYLDCSDALMEEWREELAKLNGEIQALGNWGGKLETEIKERDGTIERLQAEAGAREETIRNLEHEIHELQMGNARRDAEIRRLQEEFEDRTRWALELQSEVARRDEQLRQCNELADSRDHEIHRIAGELAGIRHALLYRVLSRLGLLPR